MSLTLSSILGYLDSAGRRSAEYSERHFRLLGVLSVVIPIAYVVDYYVGRPSFDTLLIRCLAFGLAIPLVAYGPTTASTFPNYHRYFVLLVAYALPFTFGLMLVLNAACTPDGQELELLWVLQYFVALFLFIQLIHNGVLATALWIGSTVFAMSALLMIEEINWEEMKRVMIYPVSGYLTALFFGIVTNRNIDYVNSEKLRAASAIGGNIAHELRTPLASIRSLARSVNRHSTTLIDAYDVAKQAGLSVGHLTAAHFEGLRTALRTIEQEVEYSNTVIDMLLLNTSERADIRAMHEDVFIAESVREALARYPFNNSQEKRLVTIATEDDFVVRGSRVILVHVFFNLIKNGIFYAQRRPNGLLNVRVFRSLNQGLVEFTDTGPGIPPNRQRFVFDRFYTTTTSGQGAGIGLSFCKMVMESIGGEIQCESKEGEYTTFRLIFPAVSEPETPSRNS